MKKKKLYSVFFWNGFCWENNLDERPHCLTIIIDITQGLGVDR